MRLKITQRRSNAFGSPQYRQVRNELGRRIDGAGLTVFRADKKLLLQAEWEDRMPSLLNEALEWLDRAEQAQKLLANSPILRQERRYWSLPTTLIGWRAPLLLQL